MVITENVPLAPLTTLKVGGAARYFIEAETIDEVSQAVEFARSNALPLFVLGGGSNLVISDAGWPGLVLKVGITGINHRHGHEEVVFEASAGEDWDKFVGLVVAHNCSGVECLSGIPGNVGGTPVQNVGAYGQEVANTIESVLVLDLKDGQLHELCKEACGFSYRSSIFNTSERGRYIILRVNYTLKHGGEAYIAYADLKRYFAGWSEKPSLANTRDAVRKIRAGKGMLITAGDDDCRSAGSFFKNPIVSEEQYQALTARAAAKNLQIPSYPALDAQKKVSAAWLVEHSGFSRGYGNGSVGISRKHALAIVNRGNATATDVVALKEDIQQRVEEIWGILLEPEPVFVGF
ncbi:MAG TPA: UDP-N-acetylmuramate dehydrogenase [Terriglobales bacterium]|nr:UDP-N-acetylmuramate dehydrogenase [Terriglobales bacterium]